MINVILWECPVHNGLGKPHPRRHRLQQNLCQRCRQPAGADYTYDAVGQFTRRLGARAPLQLRLVAGREHLLGAELEAAG
ncbi:hypothetical protein [Amycolatopsis sp. lyj-346]|uniref:hypothetical protein n=1 Tax=Amycolatopsis sp. lyj-346 TaxID=2789289 RepID=UPI0039784741